MKYFFSAAALAAVAAAQNAYGSSVTPAAYGASSTPIAGFTRSDGGYACNPAHQYPTGQTCVNGPNGPVLSTIMPSAASSTPLAGFTRSDGGYACNPAHQYPTGQTCVNGPNGPVLSTVMPSAASSTPLAGFTRSDGGYACNPAHQYPTGQTCVSGPNGPVLSTVAPSMAVGTAQSIYPAASTPVQYSASTTGGVAQYTGAADSIKVAGGMAGAAAVAFAAIVLQVR